ncbi:MAG: hypothetical protein J07HR59_01638, partial [Halorubrum sp. J07HR59]
MTSIRWGLQPRNSGMSDGGLVVVSGTKLVTFRTTTSSPRTSRLTNAMMTSTRSQVSAFFKNSLRRSNLGIRSDKTETREQTRRTTASVEMTIHEAQSHSKTEDSNATRKQSHPPVTGRNLKDYWSDFILCKYQTRPNIDLSTVESVQQIRAV